MFDGLYKVYVMPFGLCNALSMFQRLMQKAFAGICSVYIDDILVFQRMLRNIAITCPKSLVVCKKLGRSSNHTNAFLDVQMSVYSGGSNRLELREG